MSLPDRILQSKAAQTIFVLLGAFAAIVKLVAFAFPNLPVIAQWIATVSLLVVGIYFAFVILRKFLVLSREEDVYRHNATRYGVGYDTISVEWAIREDGSAQVRREVEVEAFSEIIELDTFLLLPEAVGHNHKDIDVISVRSLTTGWDVVITRSQEKTGALSAVLAISPPLRKNDRIAYELVESLPVGLYAIDLKEEELKNRKTSYDYSGWNVNRPSRRLSLRVYFPEGMKPLIYAGEVRYASASPGLPSDRRQHDEENRLSGPQVIKPIPEHYGLKLDIDYPMIGLIYIIRWQPVPKTTE
jgi:hypothetical protein